MIKKKHKKRRPSIILVFLIILYLEIICSAKCQELTDETNSTTTSDDYSESSTATEVASSSLALIETGNDEDRYPESFREIMTKDEDRIGDELFRAINQTKPNLLKGNNESFENRNIKLFTSVTMINETYIDERLCKVRFVILNYIIRAVTTFLFIIIFLFGLIGNSLALCLIIMKRGRLTITDIFIGNLAVSDIILSAFGITIGPITVINYGYWFMGVELCRVFSFTISLTVYTSTFTMICIAYHRYELIVNYHKANITRRKAFKICGSIWCISTIIAGPYSLSMDVVREDKCPFGYCDEEWSSSRVSRFNVSLFTLIMQFFVPLITASYFYGSIFITLKKNEKRQLLKRPRAPDQSEPSIFGTGQHHFLVFSENTNDRVEEPSIQVEDKDDNVNDCLSQLVRFLKFGKTKLGQKDQNHTEDEQKNDDQSADQSCKILVQIDEKGCETLLPVSESCRLLTIHSYGLDLAGGTGVDHGAVQYLSSNTTTSNVCTTTTNLDNSPDIENNSQLTDNYIHRDLNSHDGSGSMIIDCFNNNNNYLEHGHTKTNSESNCLATCRNTGGCGSSTVSGGSGLIANPATSTNNASPERHSISIDGCSPSPIACASATGKASNGPKKHLCPVELESIALRQLREQKQLAQKMNTNLARKKQHRLIRNPLKRARSDLATTRPSLLRQKQLEIAPATKTTATGSVNLASSANQLMHQIHHHHVTTANDGSRHHNHHGRIGKHCVTTNMAGAGHITSSTNGSGAASALLLRSIGDRIGNDNVNNGSRSCLASGAAAREIDGHRFRRSRQTNLKLFAALGLFTITWLPLNLYNIVGDALDPVHSEAMAYLYILCQIFASISCCLNPILYAVKSENWRQDLLNLGVLPKGWADDELDLQQNIQFTVYNNKRNHHRTEDFELEPVMPTA